MKVKIHRINNPLIAVVDNLLPEETVDALIAEIDEYVTFEKAQVVGNDGEAVDDYRRTNWSASHSLDYGRCPAAREFLIKASSFLTVHPAQAEPLSVIKYEIGQQYEAHHDTFTMETLPENKPEAGNRVCTAIIYLKEPIEGGETDFPHWPGIDIEPKKGRVVFFTTTHMGTDIQLDTSLHASKPVIKGEKLAANLWFRQTTYDESLLPDIVENG